MDLYVVITCNPEAENNTFAVVQGEAEAWRVMREYVANQIREYGGPETTWEQNKFGFTETNTYYSVVAKKVVLGKWIGVTGEEGEEEE